MKLQKRYGIDHGSAQIRRAYADATAAAKTAVDRALVCGQMLAEQRDFLGAGPGRRIGDDSESFDAWMERECPEIPRRTAFRWMQAAESVVRHLPSPLPEIDIPISDVLTRPEADLTEEQAIARQMLMEFVEDKTINECIKGIVHEGDGDNGRLNRAAAGKFSAKAGGSGDRKDWPKFVATHLRQTATHLGSWASYSPLQRQQAADHIESFLDGLGREMAETFLTAAKNRLKKP